MHDPVPLAEFLDLGAQDNGKVDNVDEISVFGDVLGVDTDGGDAEAFGAIENVDDEAYEKFVDAVLADECAVYQISDNLFVVNGWDQRLNMSMVSIQLLIYMLRTECQAKNAQVSWYHLQMTIIGLEIIVVCLCPQARADNTSCYHTRFVREYQSEKFPKGDMFVMGEFGC